MSYDAPQDTVAVAILVEEFVTSDSVKISVTANAVVPAEGADMKKTLNEALNKAQPGAEWYFTSLTRRNNESAQEIVTATAQARIADKELNGLQARLDKASYSGLKLTQGPIDYSPRKEQLDEANKKLRRKAYEQAVAEVALINEVITDGEDGAKWRVGQVEFGQMADVSNAKAFRGARAMAASLESTIMYDAANGGGADDSMNLTRKMELHASVTLTRKVYAVL
jgi:hypothetical protein